jgi:hypothetical protein
LCRSIILAAKVRASPKICGKPLTGTCAHLGSLDSPEADANVLRHYDFTKGLLGSLCFAEFHIWRTRHRPSSGVSTQEFSPLPKGPCFGSLLVCLSLCCSVCCPHYFLWGSRSLGIIAPFAEARANGFALTDDGGVFVSLVGWQNSENILRHGLYKLQATAGNPVATLIPVGGQSPQSYAKIVEMLFPTARSSNCTALREMNWLSDRQAMAGGDLGQKPQHPCQVLLASGAFRTPSPLGAVTR